MQKEEYEKMYHFEKEYWWFSGKRFLVKNCLKKFFRKENLKILDVGCGTGLNMKMMSKFGDVSGVDVAEEALGFCKKRGLSNVKESEVEKLDFEDKSFDVVTALDVLYHKNVKDDIKAMKEIGRVLKPNGYFIMTDSAMKCLYGKHDLAQHGIRRYSKKELKSKLKEAGFEVKKISYYNTLLFPPVYVKRKLDKLSDSEPKGDVQEINPLFNFILKMMYKLELSFLKYVDYPFGVSILAVCRKR